MLDLTMENLPRTIAASPLVLSDRLLALAQDADRAGYVATADRLVMLAHHVFDDATRAVPLRS